jgi:exopolyphosphatase/guanosine-5'-triphosphate,3'-diphosphate pyrophosphatase
LVLAIDVGTNTVLGCVAERVNDAIALRYDEERIVGLGRGVDALGALAADRIEAAIDAVRAHCDAARALGCERMIAVGTSALRDASNADAFLWRARELLPIEVISGEREAQLTFGGAGLGLGLWGPTAVLDIGGGSTELVLGAHAPDRIEQAVSIDIGSVRLFERCLSSDPPSAAELSLLDSTIAAALSGAPEIRGRTMVAVAGTACSVAMLARGRIEPVHGARLSKETITEVARELASHDHVGRVAMPGMIAARADVLVAGAKILEAVVRHAGVAEITVSEGGVRHGLVRELLGV